ncbi:hypothetical protein AAY473_035866, partial [Plecturocebus cupreus]
MSSAEGSEAPRAGKRVASAAFQEASLSRGREQNLKDRTLPLVSVQWLSSLAQVSCSYKDGCHHIGQAGLKLLTSDDLPTSASQSAEITVKLNVTVVTFVIPTTSAPLEVWRSHHDESLANLNPKTQVQLPEVPPQSCSASKGPVIFWSQGRTRGGRVIVPTFRESNVGLQPGGHCTSFWPLVGAGCTQHQEPGTFL